MWLTKSCADAMVAMAIPTVIIITETYFDSLYLQTLTCTSSSLQHLPSGMLGSALNKGVYVCACVCVQSRTHLLLSMMTPRIKFAMRDPWKDDSTVHLTSVLPVTVKVGYMFKMQNISLLIWKQFPDPKALFWWESIPLPQGKRPTLKWWLL